MSDRPAERLAVFSTIHPGSIPYAGAWFDSLCGQTTDRFDLWAGLDGVPPASLGLDWSRLGRVRIVEGREDESSVQLRRRVWAEMTGDYDAIVMVDSDDVLLPGRVAAAGRSLAGVDVSACALELIDPEGRRLGRRFTTSAADTEIGALLERNVFGLSNTVWRSRALEAASSGGGECVLLDWLLATRASLGGWRLGHDPSARMLYRVHGNNVVNVVPPFTGDQIRRNTRLVLDHFRHLRHQADDLRDDQKRMLAEREDQVRRFRDRICRDDRRMERYLEKLNETHRCLPWHACVAHSKLRSLWN